MWPTLGQGHPHQQASPYQGTLERLGGCDNGCNGPDFFIGAGGGVLFGNGQVAGGNGTATFTARLNTGDNADEIVLAPSPPPPFAGAAYQAGDNNEFHVVIRHGYRPGVDGGAVCALWRLPR